MVEDGGSCAVLYRLLLSQQSGGGCAISLLNIF